MNSKGNPNDQIEDSNKPILSEKEYQHKRLVTNITWIICLLVIVIISLISEIFCKILTNADTLKVFIEYSATLLSITLSIFAIAFTYTSNNSVQHQFDKIDNASRIILESSQSLQATERDLTGSLGKLHDRIKQMEADIDFIKGNIPNIIPPSIPDLEKTKQNLIS